MIPASIFAATAVLAGFAIAAIVAPHQRGVAIYVSLTIAWFGGDALDWALRQRHRRPA